MCRKVSRPALSGKFKSSSTRSIETDIAVWIPAASVPAVTTLNRSFPHASSNKRISFESTGLSSINNMTVCFIDLPPTVLLQED